LPNSTWERHGGGEAICNKCVRTKQEEIIKHNKMFTTPQGAKKDPNCQHEWVHPFKGRWTCVKCNATYNWMCGCGGSMYVCEEHYDRFILDAMNTHGSIELFLKERAW